jgi:hypothetical protein
MPDTLVPRLLGPPDRSFFLYGPRFPGGGKDSWRTDDGVEVISAARFNDELAKGL